MDETMKLMIFPFNEKYDDCIMNVILEKKTRRADLVIVVTPPLSAYRMKPIIFRMALPQVVFDTMKKQRVVLFTLWFHDRLRSVREETHRQLDNYYDQHENQSA